MDVKEYVLKALQKKYTLPENIDLEKFNYIETGYMDSLGIIKFVVALEDDFNVEFTDDEFSSPSFQTIGGLIELIERKMANFEGP